jgi:hypothetical protein
MARQNTPPVASSQPLSSALTPTPTHATASRPPTRNQILGKIVRHSLSFQRVWIALADRYRVPCLVPFFLLPTVALERVLHYATDGEEAYGCRCVRQSRSLDRAGKSSSLNSRRVAPCFRPQLVQHRSSSERQAGQCEGGRLLQGEGAEAQGSGGWKSDLPLSSTSFACCEQYRCCSVRACPTCRSTTSSRGLPYGLTAIPAG